MNRHRASRWHLMAKIFFACSSQREPPRDKPLVSSIAYLANGRTRSIDSLKSASAGARFEPFS